MRPEFASMSRRASNVVSEMDSHLTILKPRESTPSDILSAVAMFLNVTEKETWIRRAKLFFRILSFSLGPGNIWRFPQQSFIYGNATYLYFYILYSWTVGVSVLVFEIHLSQYFLKGFARLFTLCPIMEGITLAMVFYCIMATILYSMIGVYSFVYILSGFYFEMPHSYCSEDIINYDCESRYTNRTHSPEYVYFYKYVERLMENYGDIYNWRNAVILIIMWSIVACIIWQGLLRFHWIGTVLSILITVVLLFVAILSLTLPGAFDGVSRMFVPRKNDINHIQTWIYPLEQSIVSLGVGAGPLTTIWTMSKIKYWSPVDCVLINIITFLCSMLAGIIFFNAAGAVTIYTNSTIDKFIGDCQKDVHIHVIYTPMFNMLDMGLSNFTVAIYYFVLFCSCLYSLLEYFQILLLYIGSYINVDKKKRKIIIVITTILLYILAVVVGTSPWGFAIIMAINKNFIATALLIIIAFELVSVSYFYGLYNFCDDIEFMLGVIPSYFFQVLWLILPTLFSVFSVVSLWLKFTEIKDLFDTVFLFLTILFSIVPIIGIAAIKCVIGIRETGIRRVINPRLNESDWDSDSQSNKQSSKEVPASVPASQLNQLFKSPSASNTYNTDRSTFNSVFNSNTDDNSNHNLHKSDKITTTLLNH